MWVTNSFSSNLMPFSTRVHVYWLINVQYYTCVLQLIFLFITRVVPRIVSAWCCMSCNCSIDKGSDSCQRRWVCVCDGVVTGMVVGGGVTAVVYMINAFWVCTFIKIAYSRHNRDAMLCLCHEMVVIYIVLLMSFRPIWILLASL